MSRMSNKILLTATLLAVLLSAWAAIEDYFLGDLFLARALQEIKLSAWVDTMEIASTISTVLPIVALSSVLLAWFIHNKQRTECIVLGVALVSLLVNPVLKLVVDRPRPTDDLITIWKDSSGLGFPSGHAYTAMVLFGLLYYFTPIIFTQKKIVSLIRLFILTLITLIGISRVYLGAHWPSDVLGGFLVGGIILTLLIQLHRQYSPQVQSSEAG